VDRDARLLHRRRAPDRAVELDEPPAIGEPLAAEHELEHLEGLAEPGGAVRRRPAAEAEGPQLGIHRPPPEPELEPPAADDVERGGHLGEQRRVAERVAQHEVADADGGRPRREGRGEGPALERVGVGQRRRGQVVHQPHRVEAQLLGRAHPRFDRRERHAHLRQEQADAHATTPGRET
jgi:hypothetical protein